MKTLQDILGLESKKDLIGVAIGAIVGAAVLYSLMMAFCGFAIFFS